MSAPRILLSTLSALLFFLYAGAQLKTGDQLLRAMWKKYNGKPARCVTFTQKTTRAGKAGNYQATWYENICYPDKFRIDFDTFPSPRAVIFRNDSHFVIRNGEVVKKNEEKNELLLLLGGMYFRKLDDVMARITASGYDLGTLRDTLFTGTACFIIGKKDGKQIWVEKKLLRVKRLIVPEEDLDAIVEEWAPSGKAWMEKKISFWSAGQLVQSEEYINLEFNRLKDDQLFSLPGELKK